ncbi:MAG TPA: glycosyltransferase family 2 protein [Polyangiaceae bacterium]|nr:glycosyltransferase family 2 protein [Polyangiaceae bacterium]
MSASRQRTAYVACSVCGELRAEYLFFRAGVRFVRCVGCGLVYVSPVGAAGPCYFDMAEVGRLVTPRDRKRAVSDLADWIRDLAAEHAARTGRSPRRSVLLGRYLPELAEQPELGSIGLSVVPIAGGAFVRLSEQADLSAFSASLGGAELVILNELLEACSDPGTALAQVAAALPTGATVAIAYADVESLPARLLRRHWPAFFDLKRAFFGLAHLTRLAERCGLGLVGQRPLSSTRSSRYALERVLDAAPRARRLAWLAPSSPALKLLTGLRLATFQKLPARPAQQPDKLSVVLPVFEEASTVRQVIDTLLAKSLRIDKELIIVESGSRDGTREIVAEYQGRPNVRVLFEPLPRGKGHAVRTGLAACTGNIVLIQDADLEYDIEDYDALLEPILQGRSSFVLGSRTLGAGDWKVRRFASGAAAGLMLNLAQVGFATTFNLLYQQRTTDVNTMFKVFRRSCLDGIVLDSDGFELDIELVCKLVLAGHAPLEVPVNYVARDFSQGKKIRFLRDAWSGYAAFFKYRWGGG